MVADGTKNGLGLLLGWLTSLVLVIAVVVLITGGRPVRFRTVPSTVSLIIKFALPGQTQQAARAAPGADRDDAGHTQAA